MKIAMLRIMVLLLLSGCSGTTSVIPVPADVEQPNSHRLMLFGGDAGWKPIAESVSVEAYRIEEFRNKQVNPHFLNFPIISGPHEVNQELSQELARILADPKTLQWKASLKECEFVPGIGLRFVGVEKTTEILICFSCDQIVIEHDGESTGVVDADAARNALVIVAKKIFPDDKIVQAMQTREEQQEPQNIPAKPDTGSGAD